MDENTPKNTVDKAADSAKKGIDVTKNATNSALDSASAKVDSIRDSLSPAVDDAVEFVVGYTKDKPFKALLAAAATGALLALIFR